MESSEQIVQPTVIASLKDSASYTLDGTTFICNTKYGDQWGNRGVNLDTTNGVWKWDADTIQYIRTYRLGTSLSFSGNHPGRIEVSFAQKFAKRDIKETNYQFYAPASDTLLYYPRGSRPYMMDKYRFNRENGIRLSVNVGSVGVVPITWSSSSASESPHFPPILPPDSQKDSKFEITNLRFVPASDGYVDGYLLEAKFSCLLFDGDNKPHRLENGYMRLRVH